MNIASPPFVQAFIGSVEGVRARKGVLIPTSNFSSDARAFVGQIEKKIVLIDGEHLANLMVEHNLGVITVTTYEIKQSIRTISIAEPNVRSGSTLLRQPNIAQSSTRPLLHPRHPVHAVRPFATMTERHRRPIHNPRLLPLHERIRPPHLKIRVRTR